MDLNSTYYTVSGLTLLRPLTVFFIKNFRFSQLKKLKQTINILPKNFKSQRFTKISQMDIYIYGLNPATKNPKLELALYYFGAGISRLYKIFLTIKENIK